MGDMADWLTEQGEDAEADHAVNGCDQYPCNICGAGMKKKRKKQKMESVPKLNAERGT